MSKLMRTYISPSVAILCFLFIIPHISYGAYFYFQPQSVSTVVGQPTTVDLMLNTETEQVISATIVLNSANQGYTISYGSAGTMFPIVNSTSIAGRLVIQNHVIDVGSFAQGIGKIASLQLIGSTQGSYALPIYCDPNISDYSRVIKNDYNATNILKCSLNGSLNIGISTTQVTNPCLLKYLGDADCDNKITLADFEIWRKEYGGTLTTISADFDNDNKASIADFEIFRKRYTYTMIPYQQSNNTKRSSDVNAILNAINQYQVDHSGSLPPGITNSTTYMSTNNSNICASLMPTYIAALPQDPLVQNSLGYISSCTVPYQSGYTVFHNPVDGRITIAAPLAELGAVISVTR